MDMYKIFCPGKNYSVKSKTIPRLQLQKIQITGK